MGWEVGKYECHTGQLGAGHGLVTDRVTKNKFEHAATVIFSRFM